MIVVVVVKMNAFCKYCEYVNIFLAGLFQHYPVILF